VTTCIVGKGKGRACVAKMHSAQHTRVIAFYSAADGIGRSATVANLALMIASQGYRVLAVDLNLAAPALHRYLAAFFPPPDTRIALRPVHLTCDFVDSRAGLDYLGALSDFASAPADFVSRAGLTAGDYDFVLLDLPADDGSATLAASLADVLVLGYTPHKQVRAKARLVAQAVASSDRGPQIELLPVPMNVERHASAVAVRNLAEARLQFGGLVRDWTEEQRQQYWQQIEIPFEPEYALEERLSFLDDATDQRNRLTAAYQRLATQLAAEGPAERAAVTPATRARYRAARRASAHEDPVVTVLHAPADRYWAEWLVGELREMGLTAARQRIDQVQPAELPASSRLLVVSARLVALPELPGCLAALGGSHAAGGHTHLAVSIDGTTLPEGASPSLGQIVLPPRAKSAHHEIAAYYQVPGAEEPPPDHLYFPHRRGKGLSNVDQDPGLCLGRDDLIDRIRDHFTGGGDPAPLILTGAPGIGKSRLALEYASRFADYYDLVFYISAESVQSIRAGLEELQRLIQVEQPGGDAEVITLRYLQTETRHTRRWLLIYDGADDPAILHERIPEAGHGHVLITARALVPDSSVSLPVGPLDRAAADVLLMSQVRGILPAQAAQVTPALDGVPLAIRLAAGWLDVVESQLRSTGGHYATATGNAAQELVDQLAARRLDGGAPDSVRDMTALLVAELLRPDERTAPHGAPLAAAAGPPAEQQRPRKRGAAAFLLLQLCAFLGPAGLSARLLRSPAMLAQLTETDPDLSDPIVTHDILRTLVRYGFCLHWENPEDPLHCHPRVLELIRDRMSPQQRAAGSRAATRMLAASAPIGIDDDVKDTAIYAELLQHVASSGALFDTADEVRSWLVTLMRYLWQQETVTAWRTGAELGEQLAAYWETRLPGGPDDPLLLRLRTQLANIYRSQCEFKRAYDMDKEVLERQRRTIGPQHLRTLMTLRSMAADHRLAGEFEEALLMDYASWEPAKLDLGEDHLITIRASSNLALSQLVYGDPENALQRQLADLERCRRIRSEPAQEPWIQFHVGTLLRELGWWAAASERFVQAIRVFDGLVSDGTLAPTLWVVLRTRAGLAITERRRGRPDLRSTEEVLSKCRNTYGDRYPDVLALYLSKAGDLHATGRSAEAVETGRLAREGYAQVFSPEHPFTHICEVDLSIYALAAGDIELADAVSERALTGLQRKLVAEHLWTLAAAIARANVLVARDRVTEANQLETWALGAYRRRLEADNPLTKIATINAGITEMLLNEPRFMENSEVELKRRGSIELDTPPY
jgi:Tetratricopeptide repeat